MRCAVQNLGLQVLELRLRCAELSLLIFNMNHNSLASEANSEDCHPEWTARLADEGLTKVRQVFTSMLI